MSMKPTQTTHLEPALRGIDSFTFWMVSFTVAPEGAGSAFLPPMEAYATAPAVMSVPKERYSALMARPKSWLYE